MDANGSHFILIDPRDLTCAPESQLISCDGRVCLRSNQQLRLAERHSGLLAAALAAARPLLRDDFGQIASWNHDATQVEVQTSSGIDVLRDGDGVAFTAGPGETFRDAHISANGALGQQEAVFISSNGNDFHHVQVVHLVHRVCSRLLIPTEPQACCLDENDVWVAGRGVLYRLGGRALTQTYQPEREAFVPRVANPHAFSLLDQISLPGDLDILGIAVYADQVVLLGQRDDGAQFISQAARHVVMASQLLWHELPNDWPLVTDVAMLSSHRVVLLPLVDQADIDNGQSDAVVCEISEHGPQLIAERWPLRDPQGARFVRQTASGVYYQAGNGVAELVRLPVPRVAQSGQALLASDALEIIDGAHQLTAGMQCMAVERDAVVNPIPVFDSRMVDCIWHRICYEAHVPPGAEVRIWARASDDPAQLIGDASSWHRQPDAVWLTSSDDLPWYQPQITPQPGVSGQFSFMLQRSSGNVRRLQGRYLQLAIELTSDGRLSPELCNIRVWYPRQLYQEHFLPGYMHQQERYQPGTLQANGADVRERYLGALEGVLTGIENHVATSEVLLDPLAAPVEVLPQLAALCGLPPEPQWPEIRQRRWLAAVGNLQRFHGSAESVEKALRIVCDCADNSAQVVVVENWRLTDHGNIVGNRFFR